MKDARISDHYDGQRFFNPGINTDKSLADILRWQRKRERVPWPREVANPAFPPPPTSTGHGEAAITFIGHASYLIKVDGFTLLTDPIFSDRASPFTFAGPKRVRKPGLALDALPHIDAVLLSHNHYDHMDLPSLRALASRSRPTIVTGLGNGAYLSARGIGPSVELDWWERAEPKSGLVITFVPAQHWSSRTLLDRRRTLWGGHVIETASGRLYFAGDSGYFDGFREIRSRLGPPSVALLPIGAYEPRWFMQSQHMNPTEAVEAHVDLEAAQSLATHWGTFQLTDEGIDAPVESLQIAKRERGLRHEAFLAPLPGQTILARLHQA